jgi:hypothetical protein
MVAVLSTACTTPMRASVDNLDNFVINCDRRQEQWDYLEKQKYNTNQRLVCAAQMTSALGIISNVWNGTADDTSSCINGEHEAMIKQKQRQLRQQCLLEDSFKKP